MKFGIEFVPTTSVDGLVSSIVQAENAGFDYVWVTDHYNNRCVYIALAIAALNTKRIRLGPGVTNPFHIHPAWTASAMATLNEVSNGRAVLGLGPGDRSTLGQLGISLDKPLTAVREAVEIIRKLWAGEVVIFGGDVFNIANAKLSFKPSTPIPIYIGAQGPKMLELAGAVGDGVLINASHPKDFEYAIKYIRDGVQKAGKRMESVDVVAYAALSVDEDPVKARDAAKVVVAFIIAGSPDSILERHGITKEETEIIRSSLAKGDIPKAGKAVSDKALEAFSVSGTPEECISRIEQLMKMGVTQFVAGSPLGPKKKAAIDIIGKKIIPAFR
ncbi:MAG: 5,10-methylenetetrahydromethanopterin reductase [Candidatus Nezhaarchaeota archaeon]|nr:5,10-methylenetetrahydromethanopterin reductase [Candidatus Nezhaarchaeota archaeon]MCX8141554.1 5,10-methylenetetrahydromethanopterin reductase [Candidatus Nezhaarchaeota archaeon]MDW8049821.1 5,10-methylenetetrahydromethanopterin reductase [Nitrososphaerota archaeon]